MKVHLILVLIICLVVLVEIDNAQMVDGVEYTMTNQASCEVLGGIWNMIYICTVSNLTIKEGDTLQINPAKDLHVTERLVNYGTIILDNGGINNLEGEIINEGGTIIIKPFGMRNQGGVIINNGGNITLIGGSINNYGGQIYNNLGGIITANFDAGIYNKGGKIVNNGGTIINNEGSEIYNIINGTIINHEGSIIKNNMGLIFNQNSNITNNGGIISNIGGKINNLGDFYNKQDGLISNVENGKFTNSEEGIIKNYENSIFVNRGEETLFENNGDLTNLGSFSIEDLALIYNYGFGKIENSGTIIINHGQLANIGDINNKGIIFNYGGQLFNLEVEPKSFLAENFPDSVGTISNTELGIIFNKAGGMISNLGGYISNDQEGLIFNAGGATIGTSGTIDNQNVAYNFCGGIIIDSKIILEPFIDIPCG